MKEKILVTSALPYANGPIHLGHLSGAYLPADIYVRYKRLCGADIVYICGSDEHGVPITITADKEKVSPQTIIDRYHSINKEAFEKVGMSFDIYSRTSLPIHHQTAQEFFKNFYDRKILKSKISMQFYDEQAKMFLPDRYVEGTCPKCGYEEARSDECEKCGALYEPSELKNPRSKVSGSQPTLRETLHYYFPLGDYQARLEKYVEEMNLKYGWKDNVLQYCKNWFKEGLKERAVTRDLDWGIKAPIDHSNGTKVIYVWFEAVLGYISATKELSLKKGDKELWRNYWQDPDTKYIAFIGKDNIVFHTIIFPAMLMAWNDGNPDKYILPANVPANEFLNFEGKKFSKSRGWGIDLIDFLNLFPADPLRYTLASNMPETQDTNFYWKEFQYKNNSELADIFGNFVNRVFTFAEKHFNGTVPEIGALEEIDKKMIDDIIQGPIKISKHLEAFKFKDAIFEMMNLARAGNKYFNDNEPWKTIKFDKSRCSTTINLCLQTIYALAEVFYPVIPFTCEKLFKMLNAATVDWFSITGANLKTGHKLNKSELLFEKIEDDKIQEQINKLSSIEEEKIDQRSKTIVSLSTLEKENKKTNNEKVSLDSNQDITIEEFKKSKIAVARILNAEKVKKSEKLLALKIDLGYEQRQIISGIAKYYSPEQIIGKKILVVENLKPAKLMGLELKGMALTFEKENGDIELIFVSDEAKVGSVIS